MTTFDYSRMVATALRLVERFGVAVTWRQLVDTTINPIEPTTAATNFAAVMAFVPTERIGHETRSDSDSEQRKGAVTGYMGPVVGYTPTAKDVVIRNGKTLRIKSFDEVKPAGATVLYIVTFDL